MNRPLPWPLTALLAASLSAVVLVVGFLAGGLQGRWPNAVKLRTWDAHSFSVAHGKGAKVNGAMQLRAGAGQQAIALINHVSFSADDYPYVRLAIKHWLPGTTVRLVWLTQREPATGRGITLPWGTSFVRLAGNPYWRGVVTTVGLIIDGGSTGAQLTWRSISAEPTTPLRLLHGLFAQWTTFEPWSLRSTNYIVGGARGAFVSPVVAAAAWVVMGLMLCIVAALATRRRLDWQCIGALVVLGWVALDAAWQFNLIRQLEVTHDQYAGKSQTEKHLTGIGGGVFSFVRQIKQHLPAKPVRVFVLVSHPNGENRFYRLKARYDLLPRNAYAYTQFPPSPRLLHAGDYLVTLGRIPGLSVDPVTGLMRWREQQLRVRQVFASDDGSLYQVR